MDKKDGQNGLHKDKRANGQRIIFIMQTDLWTKKMVKMACIRTNGQMDRQTNRQTDRQTDG